MRRKAPALRHGDIRRHGQGARCPIDRSRLRFIGRDTPGGPGERPPVDERRTPEEAVARGSRKPDS